MMKINKIAIALGLTSSMALVGCGDDTNISPSTSSGTTTYSVTAIDGYLSNADVWLDLNNNSVKDQGEPTARSGAGGIASLDVTGIENPEQYPVIVQAIANETIDEDQGIVTNSYTMSAPAGEKEITPLSTLVHVIVKQTANDADTPAELEQKKQDAINQVSSQLGIPVDNVLGDFIEDDMDAAAYAAENIVNADILPETPNQLESVSEETNSDSNFLKVTALVNNAIKDKIEEVENNGSVDFDNVGKAQDVPINFEIDSDGDGVPDDLDMFDNDDSEYLDTDSDGIGDNADNDDDNDTYLDTNDTFPTDSARAGDHDNDGIDSIDDAMPNDTDNDGADNNVDAFPTDPSEQLDTDEDGIGDNADAFPGDPSEQLDTDEDGTGDNADAFPEDPSETKDTDEDGTGDNTDAFPEDPSETKDTDGDGVGDNADPTPDGGNGNAGNAVWDTSTWDSGATFQ